MSKKATCRLIFTLWLISITVSAQYAPGVGTAGTDAIYCDSSAIKAWAAKCKIIRGYVRIDNKDLDLLRQVRKIAALGKPIMLRQALVMEE